MIRKRTTGFLERFLAFLAILSVTFTQICPAWALRPELNRSGLEEALTGAARSGVSVEHPEVLGSEQVNSLHATRQPFIERGDCGCFAHVGKPQSQGGLSSNAVVLAAAKALEPRGYQSASAGVVTLGDHQPPSFEVRKVLGAVDVLEEVLAGHPLPDGNIRLVHLRWPTQGEPSEDNQHPTVLRADQHNPADLEFIFNGEILNFREIDEFLSQQGILRPAHVTTDAWTGEALCWYYFQQPSEQQVSARAALLYRQSGGLPDRDDQNWSEAVRQLKSDNVHMSLLEAVGLAYGRLEGDFALIVVSEKEPDKAIGAMKGQKPLIVGRGATAEIGNFIGSEASTFIDHTDRNQALRSGDIVSVTQDAVTFYRRQEDLTRPGRHTLRELPATERPVQQLDVEEIRVSKEHNGITYPTFTEKEIAEEPDAVRRTLDYQDRGAVLQANIDGHPEPMPGLNLTFDDFRKAKGLLLLAMGTATYAEEAAAPYLFEDVALSEAERFTVDVETATTLFDQLRRTIMHLVRRSDKQAVQPTDVDGWAQFIRKHQVSLKPLFKHYENIIAIATSQSGNTMDTNQLVVMLQALGVRFIGIVNKPIETPLVRLVQNDGGLFRTKAGAEVGVASTKAFVAQVIALRVLAIYIGLVRGTLPPKEAQLKLNSLKRLPDFMDQWLGDAENWEKIRRIAKMLVSQQTLMFLSRGAEVPVSREGALKMLELAYLFAFGMDAALMKHGYIAVFPESNDPAMRRYAVATLTDRSSLAETLNNVSEIRARYGKVIAIAFENDADQVRGRTDDLITIPDVPDDLAAIMAVLPLQILAVETTKAIDKIGEALSVWAEELYWKLRQRESGEVVSDQKMVQLLQQVEAQYGKMIDEGHLELLPTAKVRQVRLLMHQAIEAGQRDQTALMEDRIRDIIRALRGNRLSTIMFFDHELARFGNVTNTSGAMKEGTLTPAERAGIGRIFQEHPFTPNRKPEEVLNAHAAALQVYYSQMASRGSTLRARYKDWRYNKGLGQFLSRDVDKPRGLAKEVTVDRLTMRLRQKLSELGIGADRLEAVYQGVHRLEGDRLVEVPTLVRAVADLNGIPQARQRRWGILHEQGHVLLRGMLNYGRFLAEVGRLIDQADQRALEEQGVDSVPFRSRFEAVFGEFDSEAEYWEEVMAKYASARLTGAGADLFLPIKDRIESLLSRTTLQWSDGFMEQVAHQAGRSRSELEKARMFPKTLAELFDPRSLPSDRGRPRDPEVAKLQQFAMLTRSLGLKPALEWNDWFDATTMTAQATLSDLRRAERDETLTAGLEEPETMVQFELTADAVQAQIRYTQKRQFDPADHADERAVLEPVETRLRQINAEFQVKQGEPTGIPWERLPPGADQRRYLAVQKAPESSLTITAAYRAAGFMPQRVIVLTLRQPGAEPRFWVLPADPQLVNRVAAFTQAYQQGTQIPEAAPAVVETQVQILIEAFQRTGMVQFDAVASAGSPGQTLLLLVTGPKTPKTHHAIIRDLAQGAGINIGHIDTQETAGYDAERVTVDAPLKQLEDQGIPAKIQERLHDLFPSQEERELMILLEQDGFNDEEIRWSLALYRPYRNIPVPRVRLDLEEIADGGQTYFVALAPVAIVGGIEATAGRLKATLTQALQQLGRPEGLPNAIRVKIVSFAGDVPPVALVLMDFNVARDRLIDGQVLETVETTLRRYAGQMEDETELMQWASGLLRRAGVQFSPVVDALTVESQRTGTPVFRYFQILEAAPVSAGSADTAPTPVERTAIVAVGPVGAVGFLSTVTEVVKKARFNLHERMTKDEAGLVVVLVDATVAQLEEKGVFRKLERRLKGGWEDRLAGYLETNRGRDAVQVDHLLALYGRYRETKGFVQDTQPWQDPNPGFEGASVVAAVFPYREGATPAPVVGIRDAISRVTQALGRAVTPVDVFATRFRETEDSPSRSLVVYVAFQDEDLTDPALGLVSHMREFVELYIALPPGTAQEAQEIPPDVPRDFADALNRGMSEPRLTTAEIRALYELYQKNAPSLLESGHWIVESVPHGVDSRSGVRTQSVVVMFPFSAEKQERIMKAIPKERLYRLTPSGSVEYSGVGIIRYTRGSVGVPATIADAAAGSVRMRLGIHLGAGLEETLSPLDLRLPDRFMDHDVVGEINHWLARSIFLRTVRERLQKSGSPPAGYQPILQVQGARDIFNRNQVTAVDFSRVFVPLGFTAEEAKWIRGVHFRGQAVLGHLRGGSAASRRLIEERADEGTETASFLHSRIYNTELEDVVMGDSVYVSGNHLIARYVIGDEASVYDNGFVETNEAGTLFGLGKEIPVGSEIGGQQIKVFPEISLYGVGRLARDRSSALQTAYGAVYDRYLAAARADYGYIGRGSILAGNTGRVDDLYLEDGGEVIGVSSGVENTVVLSGPRDLWEGKVFQQREWYVNSEALQASERTRVHGALQLRNAILQQGVHARSGAIVLGDGPGDGVLMIEHSEAVQTALVKNAATAAGVGRGEVTASAVGPQTGLHHVSLAIGVDMLDGMGNVGAGALVGSNHTGRLPDQSANIAEGAFIGLGVMMKLPANLSQAAYSLIATGSLTLPEKFEMPFSLVTKPIVGVPAELSDEFMQVKPGWVFHENLFALRRNEAKYGSRHHAKRNPFGRDDLQRKPFEIVRPSLVNMAIRAREQLRRADPKQVRTTRVQVEVGNSGRTETQEIRYFTGKEIPGIGKSFALVEDVAEGIRAYDALIREYALRGLLAELKKLQDSGRLGEAQGLLSTPSGDLRWEHERRVLGTERMDPADPSSPVLADVPIPKLLEALVRVERAALQGIEESRAKDDRRGVRIQPDYAQTHAPMDQDKFVKTAREELAQLERTATALTQSLIAAGLEEISLPAAGAPIRTVEEIKAALSAVPVLYVPMAGLEKGLAFVVAPDGLAKFGAAAKRFTPVGGFVPADLIARDAGHVKRVRADLAALAPEGFEITVHDLAAEFQRDLMKAGRVLRARHEAAGRSVQVVSSATDMAEIARFLGIPAQQSGLEELEAIAERSNDVWS